MVGPRDCHTERSKSDTERQILYDIAYMQNLKNRNRLTDLENELMVTGGAGGRVEGRDG